MPHLSVLLLGVEHPGNLGAIARAMKNFGLSDLVLISPKCDPADIVAKNRAKWANDILERARVTDIDVLGEFDLVVGTTGKNGDDFNLPRSPLTPEQLREKLAETDDDARVALLFGREGNGLINAELKLCDFVVTIPTSPEYPSLNLSHAVAVILYELTAKAHGDALLERFPLVRAPEKAQLLKMIDETLEALPFATLEKQVTQDVLWKRLAGKSLLTQREAKALMGFFRKVEQATQRAL